MALPVHDTLNVLFQGFYGLPTGQWFDPPYYRLYPETTAYVGVIAVVMAGTAFAIRRRRPEVIALVPSLLQPPPWFSLRLSCR